MWWFKKHKAQRQDAESAKSGSQNKNQREEEYTNLVTTSGKRLKKIKGGYTLIGIGSDYNESGFRAI